MLKLYAVMLLSYEQYTAFFMPMLPDFVRFQIL